MALCAALCAMAAGCESEKPAEIVWVPSDPVETTEVKCTADNCSATCCGDVCRDVRSSRMHCGACGRECGENEVCVDRECVVSPVMRCKDDELFCNGACTKVLNDSQNCGECGNVCNEGQVCRNRACVKDCGKQALCNDKCVDLVNDRKNCGKCGTVCGGNQVCSNGHCADKCAYENEAICGMQCVDVMSTKEHCGNCSTACGDNMYCRLGVCTCDEREEVVCNGRCANLNSDNEHCGKCGDACDADMMCRFGKCVNDCDGLVCDHVCIDEKTDPAHCGSCDNVCEDGETCIDGECTTECTDPTMGVCGHTCVNVEDDNDNCGKCNNPCPDGSYCYHKTCKETCEEFSETHIVCGHECVDFTENNNHCEYCNVACAPTERCVDAEGCVSTCDDPTKTVCDHVCTDLKVDIKNCGACGNACEGVDVCKDGVCDCPDSDPFCHLTCDDGMSPCHGECVHLESNEKNCGSCGNDCGEGNYCIAGECTTDCVGKTLCSKACDPSNPSDCVEIDGVSMHVKCYDLQTDSLHCGSCDVECQNNTVCTAGSCGVCAPDFVDCNGDWSDGCESTTADCICTDGDTKECYYGAAGTNGIGACHSGIKTCTNHRWGECVGMVVPHVNYRCMKQYSDPAQNDLNCDGIVDGMEDYDGDGYTICGGDCCDIGGQSAACPVTILTPELLSPERYEVSANGFDDNCNGQVDEPPKTCSATMPSDDLGAASARTKAGIQMARAMDICDDAATVGYGLVTATIQSMSSNPEYKGGVDVDITTWFSTDTTIKKGLIRKAIAIMPRLVNTLGAAYNINPRYGTTLAAISTGDISSGYLSSTATFMHYKKTVWGVTTQNSDDDETLLNEKIPVEYLMNQETGVMETFPGCRSAQVIHDGANLSLTIKAPKNASGFMFDFRFYSHEYPQYICSAYNDYFIALLHSKAEGIPKDGNIVFDKSGHSVSVNNAFFTTCTPITCKSNSDCSPIFTKGCISGKCTSEYGACPDGSRDLSAFSNIANAPGGATAWLTAKAPIVGGETFTLDFYIWDTGDDRVDSEVILDNFRWITNGETVEVGTDFTEGRT